MSTPNKRRKKNGHQSSTQPIRGLDYFFGKQKEPPPGRNGSAPPLEDKEQDGNLTDEQLARKLQAEWDAQDRSQPSGDNGAVVAEAAPVSRPVNTETHDELYSRTDTEDPEVGSPSPLRARVEHQSDDPPTQKNAFAGFGQKNTLSLQSASKDEDTVCQSIPFDQSPLTFEPQRYTADLKKQWASDNGLATYALLTRCFVLINQTQSRIKIVDTLVNLLRVIIEGDPDSLLPAVWLATNSISPPYIDLELGLGGSAISKALKKVCGLDNAGLKNLYNKYGDAGDVAFEAKKRQSLTLRKPKPLTIKSVFDGLVKIANAKGHGSVEVKQQIVERLVQDARGAEESRYIVRTLVQHLRIGAVKTTMLIALSRAFLLSRPPGADFPTQPQSNLAKLSKQDLAEVYLKGEELVKACFARRPNYNDLVPTLLEIGISDELLIRCGLALHIPLRPMLGGITRDMGEMLTKLQGRDFSCEYKYDGQRAQVHCDERGKVTIFSRHLEVMTDKYPDLVALVPKIRGEGVSSFIMEGEVVAVDRETGELKPFQILANRARKDVVIQSVKVDVCLFAFDLMYLNGEELLNRPFRERRSLLRSLFVELPGHFTWVKSFDATSADGDAVSDFFKQATAIKCEGIMVKVLDNLLPSDMQGDDVGEDGTAEPKQAPPTPSKSRTRKPRPKPGDIPPPAPPPGAEDKKSGRRKALLSTYEPDKRLDSWLKVKKDYDTTFDTIDLIPIGGWHGQGRKAKWWSPILLACRDPETGSLQAVTKCMSGFTDAFYKANRALYDPAGSDAAGDHEGGDDVDGDNDDDDVEETEDVDGATDGAKGSNVISRPSYIEYNGPEPDVWFRAHEVWEMAFADITLSPTYTAAIGLVSEERGLSLRFPRFLRKRDDKGLDEASSSAFLAGLYRKQQERAPIVGGDGGGGGVGKVEEEIEGDRDGDEGEGD